MRQINHLAVLVTVILHQVLGFLWYSPFLFVPARLAALGLPASEATAVDPVAIGIDAVTWIVAAYVMAYLVQKTDAKSAGKGAALGALLFLIEIPALAPKYAFAHIKPIVAVIDLGNLLVVTLITCSILGAWQKKGEAK
jgi:hypothetical protein